jgi:hypothetical protein
MGEIQGLGIRVPTMKSKHFAAAHAGRRTFKTYFVNNKCGGVPMSPASCGANALNASKI